jgi:hypothetical protein
MLFHVGAVITSLGGFQRLMISAAMEAIPLVLGCYFLIVSIAYGELLRVLRAYMGETGQVTLWAQIAVMSFCAAGAVIGLDGVSANLHVDVQLKALTMTCFVVVTTATVLKTNRAIMCTVVTILQVVTLVCLVGGIVGGAAVALSNSLAVSVLLFLAAPSTVLRPFKMRP